MHSQILSESKICLFFLKHHLKNSYYVKIQINCLLHSEDSMESQMTKERIEVKSHRIKISVWGNVHTVLQNIYSNSKWGFRHKEMGRKTFLSPLNFHRTPCHFSCSWHFMHCILMAMHLSYLPAKTVKSLQQELCLTVKGNVLERKEQDFY